MTTEPLPAPPSGAMPPPPAPPTPKGRGGKAVLYTIAACAGLFVLLVVVIAASGGGKTKDQGPAITVSPTTTAGPASTAATTATTAAPTYKTPIPEDFTLEVVEVSRKCFGSAGCNINYRLNPTYNGGMPLDPSKSYTVVYQVNGGEDPEIGNFTVQGTNASVTREQSISTPPNPALSAVATRIIG